MRTERVGGRKLLLAGSMGKKKHRSRIFGRFGAKGGPIGARRHATNLVAVGFLRSDWFRGRMVGTVRPVEQPPRCWQS